MTIPKEYFVITTDELFNVHSGIYVGKDKLKAEELASAGIGTINHVVSIVKTVDRLTPPPDDIAQATMQFLKEVINGRKHSSSPQCLPTAHYRKLAELVEQYSRASEVKEED